MERSVKIAFQGEFEDDFHHHFSPLVLTPVCEDVL